jgi:hypothetical protein
MATIDELYQQSLLGNLPTTLTPYERIMGQMTPTMNPYTGAGVAIGGYDPALYRRMSGSGLINYGGGGGGGMGGGSGGGGGGSGGFSNPFGDLTQAQQAAYYAANPDMASVTRGLQSLFGLTSLGMLQNYLNPGFVSEQRALTSLDPAAYQAAKESFRASEIADMNAGYPSTISPEAQYGFTAEQPGTPAPDSGPSGGDGGYSGGTTGAGNDGGGIGAGEGLAQGGKVTKSHLKGPDPKGPDEGYGALLSGEYVIKKSAVNKYGTGLLDMINNGKIPAKKMKSLLG